MGDYKFIRLLLAMFLVGACLNLTVPWKALHEDWKAYALELDDEEQKGEDEESRESKEKDNDPTQKKITSLEEEYLHKSNYLRIMAFGSDVWKSIAARELNSPLLETIVPPPKSNC